MATAARFAAPSCGSFGEDVSKQLEYVPDSFKVTRHVQPKYCCTGCDRVVEAAAPSRPIERGLAGPSPLAHVIVSKRSDHFPLYRQSEIYAGQEVRIPRYTLAGWVGAPSDLLSPLVDAIRKPVLAGCKTCQNKRIQGKYARAWLVAYCQASFHFALRKSILVRIPTK